jgi:hypothetical protein
VDVDPVDVETQDGMASASVSQRGEPIDLAPGVTAIGIGISLPAVLRQNRQGDQADSCLVSLTHVVGLEIQIGQIELTFGDTRFCNT